MVLKLSGGIEEMDINELQLYSSYLEGIEEMDIKSFKTNFTLPNFILPNFIWGGGGGGLLSYTLGKDSRHTLEVFL